MVVMQAVEGPLWNVENLLFSVIRVEEWGQLSLLKYCLKGTP